MYNIIQSDIDTRFLLNMEIKTLLESNIDEEIVFAKYSERSKILSKLKDKIIEYHNRKKKENDDIVISVANKKGL